MPGGRRLYAEVACAYVLTRLALTLLGVRYHVDYNFQHFHDLDLLKERLGESLLYTHAFTPFMNLFVGLVLKASERHAAGIYQGTYWALGAAFAAAMAYALAALRVPRRHALVVVTLFCCSPPFIYFETFLHYEFPSAALLAASAALFHRALATGRFRWWLLFFADCTLLALVRTSFHLVWALALVGAALALGRRRRGAVAAAAAGPLLALLGYYAKNLALFGFFGTSSWFAFNVASMTTQRLSEAERREWVDRGKMHPVSAVPLFSNVRAYGEYVDVNGTTGVPVLDRLDRQNGAPNYNHHAFLNVSALRARDNRAYLAERPRAYLATVAASARDYFRPTTRWHPHDARNSPHAHNRLVIGPWERLYNDAFHRFPFGPFGLYVPLTGLLAYATVAAARALWGRRGEGCAEEKLVLYMAFNCAYVPGLSCLVAAVELARYRFLVEAFLWVIATWALRRLRAARGPAPPPRPEGPGRPASSPPGDRAAPAGRALAAGEP